MLALVQTLRFFSAFARLVRDPSRLDLVFSMADGADPRRVPGLAAMLQQPHVRRHLDGDLAIARVDLPALRALPEGSFGRAVAEFFDRRGYDPGSLYHTNTSDGSPFGRFKLHMERSHDLWHVVTGFDTDVAGELGLQAFTLAQTGAFLGYALLAAGLLNLRGGDLDEGHRRMAAIAHGWRVGTAARPFFGVDWAAMFAWPLEQVRAELGVAPEDVRAAALPN